MTTKKKTPGTGSVPVPRSSLALANGEKAAGARLIQKGFAFTPEMDLAFALGFPHLRYVTDDLVDDDPVATARGIIDESETWDSRLVWPRATAVAYVRQVAGDKDPSWIGAAAPIGAEQARAMMVQRMNFGSVPDRFVQPLSVQLLEALCGTAPVVEGLIDGLTARLARFPTSDDDSSYPELAVYELGYLLLRLSDEESASARKRLTAWLEESRTRAPGDREVQMALELALHGRAGAESSGYRPDEDTDVISPFSLGHVTDDGAFVADHFVRGGAHDESSWPDARLGFLGGSRVLAHEKKWWAKYRPSGAHRYLVATFGEIRSPLVGELMTAMAATSKAKKEARAWLEATAGK